MVDCRGDGNCLFLSLRYAKFGGGFCKHHQLRRSVCAEFLAQPALYGPYNEQVDADGNVTVSSAQYIASMSELGTWGGEPEIHAASAVLEWRSPQDGPGYAHSLVLPERRLCLEGHDYHRVCP